MKCLDSLGNLMVYCSSEMMNPKCIVYFVPATIKPNGSPGQYWAYPIIKVW